jgi:dihydroorotase
MKNILIRSGRIIDPSQGINKIGDILIEKTRIRSLGEAVRPGNDCEVVDAHGMVVCPGFIDLHCHLRQPGYEYKETIASGTAAAARGGFTTLCCMPNTDPPIDNKTLVSYIRQTAEREGLVRVLPIGCISRGRKGEELVNMIEMAESGVIGFSDDGSSVGNARLIYWAMEYSRQLNIPIIEHCEDETLADGGQMNEGIIATKLGLQGIPRSAEEVIVARDIILAGEIGAHVHIAHVSTRGAVELIRSAKKRGIKVTSEVTPHHLTMTEDWISGYNTNAKVNPPLRTQDDIDALLEGLNDGTIDVIATDHAPHAANDKLCEFAVAAAGISGLETAFGSLMELAHGNKISLELLIEKLTTAPAGIISKNHAGLGTLSTGAIADLIIVNPEQKWVVDVNQFVSKGKNSPLNGKTLQGKVLMTIYNGKMVFRSEGI